MSDGQTIRTEASSSPMGAVDDALLACRDVTKRYGNVTAVDDVSIDIAAGEWVSLVGPNGAGKTTLLNVLNGFRDPNAGEVFLGGENVTDVPSHRRARRGLGRTFQGIELFHGDLVSNMMAVRGIQNGSPIRDFLLYWPYGKRTESRNMERVEEIIDFLELWEYRSAEIDALPLGIQRRIDLARALALDPDILLLDEPMSGLSFDEKYDIIRFLYELSSNGMTILMIEHDLEVVTEVSDRMIVMNEGAAIARGPPDEVTAMPQVSEVYTGVGEE